MWIISSILVAQSSWFSMTDITMTTTPLPINFVLLSKKLDKAYTFLACLGGVVVILAAVYCCIQRRLCFCQRHLFQPTISVALAEAIQVFDEYTAHEGEGDTRTVQEVLKRSTSRYQGVFLRGRSIVPFQHSSILKLFCCEEKQVDDSLRLDVLDRSESQRTDVPTVIQFWV